jgi:hypothetical protein
LLSFPKHCGTMAKVSRSAGRAETIGEADPKGAKLDAKRESANRQPREIGPRGLAMLGGSGTAKERETAAAKNIGRCFLPMMWGEPEP